MAIKFQRVDYKTELNGKQQEAYNYQKVSAVLAEFGWFTIPLRNDWNGADFLIQSTDGKTILPVQLKGRLTFDKKYEDKNLYICFRDGLNDKDPWYLYPHNELLEAFISRGKIEGTETWKMDKPFHFPTLSDWHREILHPYQIAETHVD